MQDKLKEIISTSEHFGWVIFQRERELHFSQVGTNPKEKFCSQVGMNPKEMGMFPKEFTFVETVQSMLYLLGTIF